MTAVQDIPIIKARGPLARVTSFARAEAKMLMRNRTAMVNSVLLPLILLGSMWSVGILDNGEAGVGATTLIAIVLTSMLFVTYYNLVTTIVARREELVLKRLRTGQVGDIGVLAAVSVPSVLVSLLQMAIVLVILIATGQQFGTTNLLLPVVALLLGTAAFVALAAASTIFTSTAETAQISTLPVVMVTMGLSGIFFPVHQLPDTLATIAGLLPGTAVVDLFNLGLGGIDNAGDAVTFASSFSAGAVPVVVLLAWCAIGFAVCRSRFRWEPRT